MYGSTNDVESITTTTTRLKNNNDTVVIEDDGEYATFGYGSFDSNDTQNIDKDISSSMTSNQSNTRRISLIILFFILCITSVAALLGVITNKYGDIIIQSDSSNSNSNSKSYDSSNSNGIVMDSNKQQEEEDTSINFSLMRVGYNQIVIDQNIVNYKFLFDVDTIIEPYVSSNMWVEGIDDSVYYKYSVCSLDNGDECYFGSMSLDSSTSQDITVECEPFQKYIISIQQYNIATNELEMDDSGIGLCIYVRREVRTLSAEDVSVLMDAMYTMWSVSEKDGQELYGEDYHDSTYLLEFHHFNAAWQDADHIHEGNGFLPQHIKMTNIFEKSLQSINPALALPYWDFTMDASEGKSAHNSAIMTAVMFGSMTQPTDISWGFTYENDLIENAAIPDGLWAYMKAEKNNKYEEFKTGYGYMRAPWNMNPSPYVSRFTMDLQIGISLPTCTQHYALLEETDMMTFLYNSQYDPHATTHSLSGGIYGCDKLKTLLDSGYISDESNLKNICSKWIFYMKEFYRYDYLEPYDSCDVADDTQSSTCGFSCKDTTALLSNLKTKIENNVPSDMSDDGWNAWLDFVCNGDGAQIFAGDHLESASPADPSFWVIHPTLERLLQVKLMSGGFDTDEWATEAVDACDKSSCYDSETGDYGTFESCCYGHFEDSQLLDAIVGNKTSYFGDTNSAVMSATDPRSMQYSVPYIYDQFTWSHCEEDYWALIEQMSSPDVPTNINIPSSPN